MRRMISNNKSKVLNNLAVNDNGTILEVGGNLAVESISQLGYMQNIPETKGKGTTIKTGDIVEMKANTAYEEYNSFTVRPVDGSVELVGDFTEPENAFGPFSEADVGKVITSADFGQVMYAVSWNKNEYCIIARKSLDKDAVVKFVAAENVQLSSSYEQYTEITIPEHDEFKPFIKYQAGEIYMLNEDGDYVIIS